MHADFLAFVGDHLRHPWKKRIVCQRHNPATFLLQKLILMVIF